MIFEPVLFILTDLGRNLELSNQALLRDAFCVYLADDFQ